jgi:site-specific DNA-cytosine methylase
MQQITWVSDKVLQLHADCIDVVSRASRSCNCFTKAYGHFARGTGSLLATVAEPSDVDSRWQLVGGSGSLKLRGYTPPSQRVGAKPYCSNGSAAAEEEGSSGSHSSSGNGAAVASEAVTSSGTGCCEERQSLVAAWKQLGLRFFTVCEIAKLHSFPDSFSLPAGFSSRQGYQLLGNSLSVAVVADLLTYLTHSIGGCL